MNRESELGRRGVTKTQHNEMCSNGGMEPVLRNSPTTRTMLSLLYRHVPGYLKRVLMSKSSFTGKHAMISRSCEPETYQECFLDKNFQDTRVTETFYICEFMLGKIALFSYLISWIKGTILLLLLLLSLFITNVIHIRRLHIIINWSIAKYHNPDINSVIPWLRYL